MNYINTTHTAASELMVQEIHVASPNPFSFHTSFRRPETLPGTSILDIYSVNGRLLNSFNFNNSDELFWDGTDVGGTLLPEGIYLYSIYSKDTETRFSGKVVLKR
jgi:hypothetical protein